MDDICDRLRRWAHAADAVPASDLMDEAAAEIELLRGHKSEAESLAIMGSLLADSLRKEVREQRREIAALRDERAAWLAADRPKPDTL